MLLRLLALLPHKDIGWEEIGEEFRRYTLLKTRWGNIYLHRLKALNWDGRCHDHPWSFVSVLLWGGYMEFHDNKWTTYWPGRILGRPAEWSHAVVTWGVSWSLVFTGAKRRYWSFGKC